jgi:pimeloyl-ACP methyl ester carboxylesterase
MNESLRRIVSTSFGQMHARLSSGGGTGRPLVLLHMSPRSSQMFIGLQRLLPRSTVALDRLGYGFSDAPPRALDMTEYATAALEALAALGLEGEFDVLGMHTGSLEAVELAHLAGGRVRRAGIIAIPCFTEAEKAEGLASFARNEVVPVEDGSHLAAAWRGRFAYREPPWDLADIERRLVDYLLAAHPGAAYGAVFRSDYAARLASLRTPLVAFAPRDDLYEITLRSRALLPPGAEYVDLPHFTLDFLRTHTAEFAALLERTMPAQG